MGPEAVGPEAVGPEAVGPDWLVTAVPPPLQGLDIHVWSARLDQPATQEATLRQILVQDEIIRADRFHFARDRRRYIAARAILRTLLGRYLQKAPSSLSITYTTYGKPELANEGLFFNVSHSKDVALLAFCKATAVGIDVEHIRPLNEHLDIAARFFTPAEFVTLQAIAPEQQLNAFFQCWTRKEAFIKAIGEGLSFPLNAFEVAFGPQTTAQFIQIKGQKTNNWSLITLNPFPHFVGALAFHGQPNNIFCAQWPQNKKTSNI